MIAAIRDNFFQREIADASFRYQAEVEAEERIVVGVNHYELVEEDEPIPILRIDPKLELEQVERVQALRGRRDSRAVESSARAVEGGGSWGNHGFPDGEPDGADPRRREGLRDDGRNVRRLP